MFNIEINNRKVTAEKGETILSVLKRVGIKVPTLCHLEGLLPTGACRMCVVEVDGLADLVPSCSYPVSEGMKIQTHSPRVINARKTITELLLANHPDDCLFCLRNKNCELQNLAEEHTIDYRKFFGAKNDYPVDSSSPSIVRDPEKCILCGRCVRVCEEIQGVACIDFIGRGSKAIVGTAFNEGINISSCVTCGQCILVCPTGALREQYHLEDVLAVMNKKEKLVVAQHAPAISVTIGEEFGIKPGTDTNELLNSALRKAGFDRVFETSFAADLTIMEEATELVNRIKNGGKLPMFTSCSPAWVKFVEQFYPEFIDNLSTCKSPHEMLGAIIKSYYAEKENIDPENIYVVSIMPCTAKKFESSRDELSHHGLADVDASLTTRELAKLFKRKGIDFQNVQPESPDMPFGERSTAGKLFGVSGGVMEAAIRTAYYLLTGKDLERNPFKQIRGIDGRKEMKLTINGVEYGFAVVSGLANAAKLLDEIKAGRNDIHFVEVMSCPGGCINGGGQPIGCDQDAIKARMKILYQIDKNEDIWTSHQNKHVKKLYEEFLGEPNGEKSHHLLHTHYVKREVIL